MAFHEDALRPDHVADTRHIALVPSEALLDIVHTIPTALSTLLDQ
jgi:hypothetical protein